MHRLPRAGHPVSLPDAELEVCRPDDQLQDIQGRDKDLITYALLLAQSDELLCAVMLSRPSRVLCVYGPSAPCWIRLANSKMRTSDPQAKTRFVKFSMTHEISIKARRQQRLSLSPGL